MLLFILKKHLAGGQIPREDDTILLTRPQALLPLWVSVKDGTLIFKGYSVRRWDHSDVNLLYKTRVKCLKLAENMDVSKSQCL